MELTYQTNLRCKSCLATVGPVLDAAAEVRDWSANLDDPNKTLRVSLGDGVDTHRVTELLGAVGYEAHPVMEGVSEPTAEEGQTHEKTKFRLADYKPLLLAVAYVTGATAIAEFAHGGFVWQRAMSYFMGYFFLGFAFFKLLDIPSFADAFSSYDIVAKRSRTYALAYPWIELGLGVLFVTRAFPFLANVATLAVMLVGLVGVTASVRSGNRIQCACLGTVFNLPMSVVTIVENSVMAAMAATMLLT